MRLRTAARAWRAALQGPPAASAARNAAMSPPSALPQVLIPLLGNVSIEQACMPECQHSQ